MTKQEAMKAMIDGKEIKHRYSAKGEYYFFKDNAFWFKQANKTPWELLSFNMSWSDGYEIYNPKPKDKAPCRGWDKGHRECALLLLGFYDADNDCIFSGIGKRQGSAWGNYEEITDLEALDKMWPEWREAQAKLED